MAEIINSCKQSTGLRTSSVFVYDDVVYLIVFNGADERYLLVDLELGHIKGQYANIAQIESEYQGYTLVERIELMN